MSSSQDYKFALRKMEFPTCASQALTKIENLIFSTSRSKQELMMSLISEFVFYEPKITTLQEFQLVIVLCDYLSKSSLPETTRNAVFISLFGGSISTIRINVLIKLTATAIAAQLPLVLGAVGTLIQQLGCSSSTSLELAKNLVQDFVVFSNKSSSNLKELPKIAPRFVANFMTSVATLYFNETSPLLEPPDLLLDLFTEWVSENTTLCLASQQPLALPSAMLCHAVVTPIAALIRWCCLSAFTASRDNYNKLHFSLLQSISAARQSQDPPVALNAQHLLFVVNIIQNQIDEVAKKSSQIPLESNEEVQLCLERLAQAVAQALSAQCMYGNISQLLMRLESVKPNSALLQVVVKMNKHT